MIELDDATFDAIISEVMAELPESHTSRINNVAIVMADEPTPEQRQTMQLRNDQSLYGLYEGIPLTKRGAGYNLVLPDKITLFKLPLLQSSSSLQGFREQVKRTLWHEIAHHFGLDHDRIHELEGK